MRRVFKPDTSTRRENITYILHKYIVAWSRNYTVTYNETRGRKNNSIKNDSYRQTRVKHVSQTFRTK